MEMHPTETPTNSKGQCHLVIFTTGHLFVVCQYVQKTSSLNYWIDFNYLSYADFWLRGKKDIYIWSRSHDQDVRHFHIR